MESAPFLDMSHDLDQLQGFLLSSNPLGFFQLQKPIQRVPVPTGNFLQRFLSWIRFRIKKSNWIWFRIEKNSRIQIRKKGMRIHTPKPCLLEEENTMNNKNIP